MNWKDFLYFQKNSKMAVILLLILIVLTLILNVVLNYRNSSDIILVQNDSLIREFEKFRQTLTVSQPPVSGQNEKRGVSGYPQDKAVIENKSFEYQKERNQPQQSFSTKSDKQGSYGNYSPIKKLSQGETIFLNGADTTDWKKIPGIGSGYAARIVKYRDQLGGFFSIDQLLEVYGLDVILYNSIAVYIEQDAIYRKLYINQSDFKELLQHPYLNYKQVQTIMNLRRKKGDITSIRELSILDEFTSDDIVRLEHYLAF